MRTLLLCILVAACTDVATDMNDDTVAVEPDCLEANGVCEREAVDEPPGEVAASAFTCSPCPPFQLGRNVCCAVVHACCGAP
jgi:hypothetical protein